MNGRVRLRLAGLAGVLAAVAWIVGDMLLVGHLANAADYPWLAAHAEQVDARMALHLLGVPVSQLAAGALWAVFSMPLYLCGGWHLWRGLRGSGRLWSMPAVALIFLGYALSPLPHAAFYFVGATWQAVAAADPAAQQQLLTLAAGFHRVLEWTWYPAVACQLLGLLWFSAAVARGGGSYPRWFALTANPVVLGLLAIGGPLLLGGSASHALGAAAFNVIWLLVYLQSLALLWRDRNDRATDR